MDVDSIFTPEEVADMEIEIDTMQFSDLENLGVFDQEELDDFAMSDELDIHDNIDILETLTIQGRMKRRFAARRNRQKLKVGCVLLGERLIQN